MKDQAGRGQESCGEFSLQGSVHYVRKLSLQVPMRLLLPMLILHKRAGTAKFRTNLCHPTADLLRVLSLYSLLILFPITVESSVEVLDS